MFIPPEPPYQSCRLATQTLHQSIAINSCRLKLREPLHLYWRMWPCSMTMVALGCISKLGENCVKTNRFWSLVLRHNNKYGANFFRVQWNDHHPQKGGENSNACSPLWAPVMSAMNDIFQSHQGYQCDVFGLLTSTPPRYPPFSFRCPSLPTHRPALVHDGWSWPTAAQRRN